MANGNSSSGTKFQTILLFLIIFLVAGGIIYYYYNEKKQGGSSSTTYIVPVPGVPPHVIGGCAGTRYGCCPNGRTARVDMRGSNC